MVVLCVHVLLYNMHIDSWHFICMLHCRRADVLRVTFSSCNAVLTIVLMPVCCCCRHCHTRCTVEMFDRMRLSGHAYDIKTYTQMILGNAHDTLCCHIHNIKYICTQLRHVHVCNTI
jgi:pentatricopeptide repeat protein